MHQVPRAYIVATLLAVSVTLCGNSLAQTSADDTASAIKRATESEKFEEVVALAGSGDALDLTSIQIIAPALLASSSQAIIAGQYDMATAIAEVILRLPALNDDLVVGALRLKGSANLRAGRSEEAVSDFGFALTLAPDDLFLLWQRCWAGINTNKLVMATRDCQRARVVVDRLTRHSGRASEEIATDNLFVLMAEAYLAENMGNLEEALRRLAAANAIVGDLGDSMPNPEAYQANLERHRGRILNTLGRIEEAVEAFNRAESQLLQMGGPDPYFYCKRCGGPTLSVA